jgi:hypothetical protein
LKTFKESKKVSVTENPENNNKKPFGFFNNKNSNDRHQEIIPRIQSQKFKRSPPRNNSKNSITKNQMKNPRHENPND